MRTKRFCSFAHGSPSEMSAYATANNVFVGLKSEWSTTNYDGGFWTLQARRNCAIASTNFHARLSLHVLKRSVESRMLYPHYVID